MASKSRIMSFIRVRQQMTTKGMLACGCVNSACELGHLAVPITFLFERKKVGPTGFEPGTSRPTVQLTAVAPHWLDNIVFLSNFKRFHMKIDREYYVSIIAFLFLPQKDFDFSTFCENIVLPAEHVHILRVIPSSY